MTDYKAMGRKGGLASGDCKRGDCKRRFRIPPETRRAIAQAPGTQTEIAARYSVDRKTVRTIKRRAETGPSYADMLATLRRG